MFISKSKRMPEARWIGIVPLGIGDGVTTEFALPEEIGRAIIFVRAYRMGKAYPVGTDGPKTVRFPGKVVTDDSGRRVVFETAPDDGAAITAVALDHDGGELGLRVYPMTMAVNALLNAKVEEEQKARKVKTLDGVVFYKLAFRLLVSEWREVLDADTKEPVPCTDENKDFFLDVKDGGYFGSFVSEASQDLHQLTRSEAKAEEGS